MTDADGRKDETEDNDDLEPARRGKNREAFVGAFVILGLVSTIGALFVLTDAATFRGRYIIHTNVPDAGGIRKGDPVQMRGVNIGRVQRFKMIDDGKVEVRLEIEGEYPIPNDSHVKLHSTGLLGGMVAQVIPGTSAERVGYGATIAGESESTSSLSEVAARMTGKADLVLDRVDQLLSPQLIKNVNGSSTELNATLVQVRALVTEQKASLAELQASLQRSSTGFEKVTTNMQQASTDLQKAGANVNTLTARPELDRTMQRLDAFSARLDTMAGNLDQTAKSLQTVSTRIEKGDGSLGKLTRDEALYNNLNQAALNLSQLSEDIRKNPKKYINLKVF